MYSKKRADYSLEFYLNTKNCNKYQHTSNNNNNTKKMDDISSSSSSSSSSNITPHLTSLILTTINTTSSIAKDEHLHHNLPQLIQSCRLEYSFCHFEDQNDKMSECLKLLIDKAKSSYDILIKIHLIAKTEFRRSNNEFYNYLLEKTLQIFVSFLIYI